MPRIDITKNYIRKRQENPRKFDKRSFRTKEVSKNKKIILACPRKKYNPKLKRCKTGLKIQSILIRKK